MWYVLYIYVWPIQNTLVVSMLWFVNIFLFAFLSFLTVIPLLVLSLCFPNISYVPQFSFFPCIIFICHFPCLFLLPTTQCLNILNCVDIASPRDFSLLQNVQIGSGAHPASYLMGTGFFTQGYSSRGVIFTTHLHPLPMLRLSGVNPSPRLCLHGIDRKTFTSLYFTYTVRSISFRTDFLK
jgi:hypothetical protein